MSVFCATPFWRSEGGGGIVKIEKYAFPNGWGVSVIARVAEGFLAMHGEVVITEPNVLFPQDNHEREHVEFERAQELVPVPGEYPYTEHGYDEKGFAEWANLEALRAFMERVANLPTHRLVGT